MIRRINIIDTITNETGLSQIQIADRVNVSKSTISAWRMGAPIPRIKERKLMQILHMYRRHSSSRNETFDEWKILVKSPENSKNWQSYMRSFGVNLHKDWKRVLITLYDLGIEIPENAPNRLKLKSSHRRLTNNEDYDLESSWEEEEEEIESSLKLKPFDILLSKLLTNLNTLDEWCEMFLPKTRNGEFTNRSRLIQYMLVDMAFIHVDTILILNLEVDIKPFLSRTNKTKEKVSKLIQSLCEDLISNRENLKTDYFEIIKVSPDRLSKIISDYEIRSMSEPHIDDYLSYGEKRIYEAMQENIRLQNKLIERLELIRKDGIENTQIIKSNEGLLSKIKEGLIQNF